MQTGANELEGNSTEKTFGVTVGKKESKSQQYTLAEKNVKIIIDCISTGVFIRSRQVTPLLSTGKAMNSWVQHWVFQYKKCMDFTRVHLVHLA